jgi:hypothetical protein
MDPAGGVADGERNEVTLTAIACALLSVLSFQAAPDPEIVVLLKRGMANGVTLDAADNTRIDTYTSESADG